MESAPAPEKEPRHPARRVNFFVALFPAVVLALGWAWAYNDHSSNDRLLSFAWGCSLFCAAFTSAQVANCHRTGYGFFLALLTFVGLQLFYLTVFFVGCVCTLQSGHRV